jgi:hypothetical protein
VFYARQSNLLCYISNLTKTEFQACMSEQESADKSSPGEEDEAEAGEQQPQPTEYGGPKGKEPTRYGDWEKNGRCIDF